MTKLSKKDLRRAKNILVGIFLFIASLLLNSIFKFDGILKFISYFIPYIFTGYDIIVSCIKRIRYGNFLDENFLMTIATIGAFVIGEYPEAIFVILFYKIGDLFESVSVNRSRKSISSLMQLRPDFAFIQKDGTLLKTSPEELKVNDVIVIRPGDRVPIDCRVISGKSTLDTSALTGESLPKDVFEGDCISSGCINLSGTIEAVVLKTYGNSTVSRIMELVENASENKAKCENFITRFSLIYTPIVVYLAIFIGLILPLFIGGLSDLQILTSYFKKALVFLVVSCPCALVISVPLTFFCAIGTASKNGVLIKGSNFIEVLSKCKTIIFDKTGTLTQGKFSVTVVSPYGVDEKVLIDTLCLAESFSSHPIAKAVTEHYPQKRDLSRVTEVSEISGKGIKCLIDGKMVLCGNEIFLKEHGVNFSPSDFIGTVIYASIDGVYAGFIGISDKVKQSTKEAIDSLKLSGITRTVMLTGDNKANAYKIKNTLSIDKVYPQLLPDEKVEKLELEIKSTGGKSSVCFVGDGINDAPALSRSDVGIAMGALGSDAAIEAADVVLMDDNPQKIPAVISLSKITMSTVKQNIVFALGIKFLVLFLSVIGYSNMWFASFADVGVSIIAILNSTYFLGKRVKGKRLFY